MKLIDRFRGCIVGLAVGDALGHPTEFISSVASIRQRFGAKGIRDFAAQGRHPAGTFTDDTQMTVSVLRALVRRGHSDLDTLMTCLGEEFVAWSVHRDNNRAPGGTCLTGCRSFANGASWKDAGVKESKGCGAAMRAAPIGLFCTDDAQLVRLAAAQSVLTHSHPTGIASSVAAAAAVAHVARGGALSGLLDFVTACVERCDDALLREMGATPELVKKLGNREQLRLLERTREALKQDTDDVCTLLGGAWIGEEAVATALWSVLKADGDFEEAIVRGATSSGDSDSIACIAGSICGALHGYDAIPARFTAKVEKGAALDVLAQYLFWVSSTGREVEHLPGPLDFFDAEPSESGEGELDDDERTASGADDSDADDSDADDSDADDSDAHDSDADDSDADDSDADDSDSDDSDDADDSDSDDTNAKVADARVANADDSDSDDTNAKRADARGANAHHSANRASAAADEGADNADASRAGPATSADSDIARLERELTEHNRLYWVEGAPKISDTDYDDLVRQLTELAPNSPVLSHLGAQPDATGAVRHPSPMLSLDKCYLHTELGEWASALEGDVVAMPKIDGLACALHYDRTGALVRAATRGDGTVGEDVTVNARVVGGIPSRIKAGPCEVRGEIFLGLAAFEKLTKENRTNPRNLAAGALRSKDPQVTQRAGLSFAAYDLRGTPLTTVSERLTQLEALGFDPIPRMRGPREELSAIVNAMSERRQSLGYETDGVVIVADRVSEHERLGATAHHPRWAIAWKFQGEAGTSVLTGVEWSVARTGTITPVAIVEPVVLSGVTVSRATLHHVGRLEALGLTIGATLELVRRGGVIPHVEKVVSAGAAPVSTPTTCPSCGSAVTRAGDFLSCSTPDDCLAARVERLSHWAAAADIQGLGPAILEAAVTSGAVKSLADLYRLDLAALTRLTAGEKVAAKVLAELNRSRSLPLDVFLRGLGIEGLGRTVATMLMNHFPTLAQLRAANVDALGAIKGIGPISAKAISEALVARAGAIDELLAYVTIGASAAPATGPLSGTVFCFTGALQQDRSAAEARVKALGGAIASSVTSRLTHLVAVETSGAPSTKLKAARALIDGGSKLLILDEAQFNALVATAPAAAPAEEPRPTTQQQQLTMF